MRGMKKRPYRQLAVGIAILASTNLVTASDEWEFALSPLFLWGMSIKGDATIGGVTAPLDLTFNDKWSFIGRTDLGYGGSDNKAINASFQFDYRFRDWGSAFAGYRYLQYDFDNDSSSNGYAFDAYQQGPLLGLTIYW